MKNLNLCTDPWLPVRLCSGDFVRVSLEDFFSELKEISDLILAAHERISIMRLLICIAQRAINGPCDREEWDECKELFAPKAVQYLKEWRHAFNLIGEDGAFLLPSGVEAMKPDSWKNIRKISLNDPDDNSPTLFDNSAEVEKLPMLARVAIDLITYQNFSPQGPIGGVVWNGVQTAITLPDHVSDSPCLPFSAIHLFVCGKNMLETIWYNLCTCEEIEYYRKGMGMPIWEYMPCSMDDNKAIENATTTYLGRLVPMSRVVKISLSGSKCLVAKGLTYQFRSDDKSLLYYESSMSIEIGKDNTRKIVGASLDIAMWRKLPAILHRFSNNYKSFVSLSEQELPPHYGIWIGALVTNKAKVMGTMEDYYEHLDNRYVGYAADKRQAILMDMAKKGITSVRTAMSFYFQSYIKENNNEKYEHADRYFWSQLTAHRQLYLDCMSISDMSSEEFMKKKMLWAYIISRAAGYTFDLLVPRSTDRQLSAWARARQLLSSVNLLINSNGK